MWPAAVKARESPRAVSMVVLSVGLIVLLLTFWLTWTASNRFVTLRDSTKTLVSEALESSILTPANQGGDYISEALYGQSLQLNATNVPVMTSQALDNSIPGSVAVVNNAQIVWTLPASYQAAAQITGPITINQIQTVTTPPYQVTLDGSSQYFSEPVLAAAVQIPVRAGNLFQLGVHFTINETVVIPLAGRQSPTQFHNY